MLERGDGVGMREEALAVDAHDGAADGDALGARLAFVAEADNHRHGLEAAALLDAGAQLALQQGRG